MTTRRWSPHDSRAPRTRALTIAAGVDPDGLRVTRAHAPEPSPSQAFAPGPAPAPGVPQPTSAAASGQGRRTNLLDAVQLAQLMVLFAVGSLSARRPRAIDACISRLATGIPSDHRERLRAGDQPKEAVVNAAGRAGEAISAHASRRSAR